MSCGENRALTVIGAITRSKESLCCLFSEAKGRNVKAFRQRYVT